MKTTIQTKKVSLKDVPVGELYKINEHDHVSYQRINHNSGLINKVAGKVYSFHNGVIFEHDSDRKVFGIEIKNEK